jgi:hypothetical protein
MQDDPICITPGGRSVAAISAGSKPARERLTQRPQPALERPLLGIARRHVADSRVVDPLAQLRQRLRLVIRNLEF